MPVMGRNEANTRSFFQSKGIFLSKNLWTLITLVLLSEVLMTTGVGGTDVVHENSRILVPTRSTGDRVGKGVAVNERWLAIGAVGYPSASNQGQLIIYEQNATDPANWSLSAAMSSPDTGVTLFGRLVAVSNNTVFSTLHTSNSYGGKVYYTTYNDDTLSWSPLTAFEGSDTVVGDQFGWSIDVEGDTIVVGANFHEPGGVSHAGGGYVFKDNGSGTWTQFLKLSFSIEEVDGQIGRDVAIHDDIIVVGAKGLTRAASGNEGGGAFIHLRNEGGVDNWGEKTILWSEIDYGEYGQQVEVAGDIVVIGSRAHSGGGANTGLVQVYSRNVGGIDNFGWVQDLIGQDTVAGDYFGWGIALHEDLIAVTAASHSNPLTEVGAGYVFKLNDDTNLYEQIAKVNVSDPGANDVFGSEPCYNDGNLWIGAPYHTDNGDDGGTVFGFSICGDGWLGWDEECDDGNNIAGDGCNATCYFEFCGDGIVNNAGVEECDDGGVIDGDGCNSTCLTEFCGDGVVNNVNENCDDGNDVHEDECPNTCITCPLGTVISFGPEPCIACPESTYTNDPWLACKACPTPSITFATGSVLEDCVCPEEYYGSAAECTPCPVGGVCSSPGLDVPVPAPGYWVADPDSDVFLACPNPDACLGAECAEGYTGFLCSECEDGFYTSESLCLPCSSSTSIIIATVGSVLFLAFIACRLTASSAANSSLATLSGILINFAQSMVVIASFEVPWTPTLTGIFSWMSFLNFDLDSTSPECQVRLEYNDKLAAKLVLPIVAGVVIAICTCFAKLCIRSRSLKSLAAAGAGTFVSVLVLLYNSLTLSALDVFRCVEREDGSSTLVSAPAIACYEAEWQKGAVLGFSGLLVYSVLFPLVLGFCFMRASKAKTLYTLESSSLWLSMWGPITSDKYVRGFFWFELILITKKLLVIASMQWPSVFFQTLSGFFLTLGYILFFSHAMPYGSSSLNRVELTAGVSTLLTLLTAMVLGTAGSSLDPSSAALLTILVTASIIAALATGVVDVTKSIPGFRSRAKVGQAFDEIQTLRQWFGTSGADAVAQADPDDRAVFSPLILKASTILGDKLTSEEARSSALMILMYDLPTVADRAAAQRVLALATAAKNPQAVGETPATLGKAEAGGGGRALRRPKKATY